MLFTVRLVPVSAVSASVVPVTVLASAVVDSVPRASAVRGVGSRRCVRRVARDGAAFVQPTQVTPGQCIHCGHLCPHVNSEHYDAVATRGGSLRLARMSTKCPRRPIRPVVIHR